jgi:hypothetical protein
VLLLFFLSFFLFAAQIEKFIARREPKYNRLMRSSANQGENQEIIPIWGLTFSN